MDSKKNLEYEMFINSMVEYINNLDFIGTEREVKFQQILAIDKYIKENIDYSFDAINFSIKHPNVDNPYCKAYKVEGFYEEGVAVCGSISKVTKDIMNKLGIKNDYVWGHFSTETNGKRVNVGHRWNIVTIDDEDYMIDFTSNLCYYKCYVMFNENYKQVVDMFDKPNIDSINEYEFLFFDKLPETLLLGGFTVDERGKHKSDIDQNGNLRNATKDLNKYFRKNIGRLSQEYLKSLSQNVYCIIDKNNKRI